ncbi:hypothetical protein FQZ93_09600, partial [Escherichia coli]|uniref:GPO family capsid scaffolding protein n=2 Tax=Escherichia coli TaxID=562 RepID=UPI0013BAE3B8
MANEKKTSRKKFRVAVSGVTADGREINGDMLKAAATSYNPSVYGARVNIEHILSPLPGSEFSAMGDVVGLSTEDITDGPLAGRTALYTQYAQKHNPTFTGEPKAPTPAAGNNTTRIATTAFVQAAITALINGAPATLDTLKEIAAAINNDPKFSTTINNALALKAPLSSPALTGTPTAPTAAQSVNNTQIATTAFVKSAIATMVGSAPAALDTLKEIAAAINNDPKFSTTINNALALKAPLSSPALTGTPTAPTAAQSVNNTQIATTAFVKSAIATMVGSAPAAL